MISRRDKSSIKVKEIQDGEAKMKMAGITGH